MRLLHNLVYRHDAIKQDNVGTVILCTTRGRNKHVHGATFYPALPGADGHVIPSASALAQILFSETAIEAMAALRAAEEVA